MGQRSRDAVLLFKTILLGSKNVVDSQYGPETWYLLLRKSPVGDTFQRVGVGQWNMWRRAKTRIFPLFEHVEDTTIDIV
jgi:hypothetical protein